MSVAVRRRMVALILTLAVIAVVVALYLAAAHGTVAGTNWDNNVLASTSWDN